MNAERPEQLSEPLSQVSPATSGPTSADTSRQADTQRQPETRPQAATVLVRGETVQDLPQKSSSQKAPSGGDEKTSPRKEVSAAKAKMQSRLPVLDDDTEVGIQKEHTVIRDGKADLSFTGTLLASAAPSSAPLGHWLEYRIYATSAGKHVFSKVTRRVFVDELDSYEADIFDPSPTSVPANLLRSARDLARSRPITWMDAAVEFFGYDPLAKALYRKFGGQFEEHIS